MNITQDLDFATFSLINTLTEPPIAFHVIFAKIGGGVTEGLFLSYLYNITKLLPEDNRWINKSYAQWQEDLCLTRREVDAGRKKLKELGVLQEKKAQGANRTVVYKLDIVKVQTLIYDFCKSKNSTDVPNQITTAKPEIESIKEDTTKASVPVLPLETPAIESEPLPLFQTYSSTQKFEDKWKPKPLQSWRTGSKTHQYKTEVVNYLKNIYLPKTPFYEGKNVTTGDAVRWLAQREYDNKGIALIEAMMIDFNDYNTPITNNAAKNNLEINNLPLWVKQGWGFTSLQYKEYLECGCDLNKFHYTKSQAEIDVWEKWISEEFPDKAPNMFRDKHKVLNNLKNVA